MLEPWNDKLILPPPVNTFLSKENVDIGQLKYIIDNVIRILSKQSPLHKEGALFSRLIYKFDKKFRNDIGYRNFRKVFSALRKFLSLNLIKDVESFNSILPNDEEDQENYLPTRQMLEYLLLRIITFSKIVMRIVVCAKQASIFYLDRIRRGESHWMSLMPYALLSRVWSMATVLLQHSCNWYNQIILFLDKLQIKGLTFLPPNYELPKDLEEWLDLKNINNYGRLEWSNKISENLSEIIAENDNDDFCESILEYVEQINNNNEDSLEKFQITSVKVHESCAEIIHRPQNEDTGVAISRESLKTSVNIKTKEPTIEAPSQMKPHNNGAAISSDTIKYSKPDPHNHSIDGITNNHMLNEFINNEETYRNESSDEALTSHLSFMQWMSLKNSLINLDSQKSRKLQRKIQKIWQEKCIECK